MTRYLGIDPGLDGAAVLLDVEGGKIVGVKSRLFADLDPWNYWTCRDLLSDLVGDVKPIAVALEMGQATRTATGGIGQGSYGTGVRWGQLEAAVCQLFEGQSIRTPGASSWSAKMLKDLPGEGKARAIRLVQTEIPDLDLTPGRRRKPHDGIADAGCLALYAWRWIGR